MLKEKRILTDEEKEKIRLAKQELNEYRNNIDYIKEKQNDMEEIKTMLEKTTTRLSATKTSGGTSVDKFADGISRLDEMEKEQDEKLQELMLKRYIVEEKIENVGKENAIYRNILFYRYMRNMSWENIADKEKYSLSHIYELHGDALYIYSKL